MSDKRGTRSSRVWYLAFFGTCLIVSCLIVIYGPTLLAPDETDFGPIVNDTPVRSPETPTPRTQLNREADSLLLQLIQLSPRADSLFDILCQIRELEQSQRLELLRRLAYENPRFAKAKSIPLVVAVTGFDGSGGIRKELHHKVVEPLLADSTHGALSTGRAYSAVIAPSPYSASTLPRPVSPLTPAILEELRKRFPDSALCSFGPLGPGKAQNPAGAAESASAIDEQTKAALAALESSLKIADLEQDRRLIERLRKLDSDSDQPKYDELLVHLVDRICDAGGGISASNREEQFQEFTNELDERSSTVALTQIAKKLHKETTSIQFDGLAFLAGCLASRAEESTAIDLLLAFETLFNNKEDVNKLAPIAFGFARFAAKLQPADRHRFAETILKRANAESSSYLTGRLCRALTEIHEAMLPSQEEDLVEMLETGAFQEVRGPHRSLYLDLLTGNAWKRCSGVHSSTIKKLSAEAHETEYLRQLLNWINRSNQYEKRAVVLQWDKVLPRIEPSDHRVWSELNELLPLLDEKQSRTAFAEAYRLVRVDKTLHSSAGGSISTLLKHHPGLFDTPTFELLYTDWESSLNSNITYVQSRSCFEWILICGKQQSLVQRTALLERISKCIDQQEPMKSDPDRYAKMLVKAVKELATDAETFSHFARRLIFDTEGGVDETYASLLLFSNSDRMTPELLRYAVESIIDLAEQGDFRSYEIFWGGLLANYTEHFPEESRQLLTNCTEAEQERLRALIPTLIESMQDGPEKLQLSIDFLTSRDAKTGYSDLAQSTVELARRLNAKDRIVYAFETSIWRLKDGRQRAILCDAFIALVPELSTEKVSDLVHRAEHFSGMRSRLRKVHEQQFGTSIKLVASYASHCSTTSLRKFGSSLVSFFDLAMEQNASDAIEVLRVVASEFSREELDDLGERWLDYVQRSQAGNASRIAVKIAEGIPQIPSTYVDKVIESLEEKALKAPQRLELYSALMHFQGRLSNSQSAKLAENLLTLVETYPETLRLREIAKQALMVCSHMASQDVQKLTEQLEKRVLGENMFRTKRDFIRFEYLVRWWIVLDACTSTREEHFRNVARLLDRPEILHESQTGTFFIHQGLTQFLEFLYVYDARSKPENPKVFQRYQWKFHDLVDWMQRQKDLEFAGLQP